jgi:predicted dehydrogenase
VPRETLRFALIGAGFIGRIHGLALGAVNHVFGRSSVAVEPTVLIDADAAVAERQGRQLGFQRWGTDWAAAIDDVDAVIIAVPSFMHREIALAAIERGKHLLCEKPVGCSAAESEAIAEAAARAGVCNGVGFTYMRAPMVQHAVRLVQEGVIGRPLTFRGWHAEDYLADGEAPFAWRLDASLAGRCGALGDLGWHIISIARALCGPVRALSGLVSTAYPTRPLQPGGSERRQVENEDWAAATVRFDSGVTGTIEASRIAHGRRMDIGFELTGTEGTLAFDGERANELQLYRAGDKPGADGFRRILISGAHPDYGAFLPAPAHGLGFNDLKTIELHHFREAVAAGRNLDPDLGEAVRIARICEAIHASSETGARVDEPERASASAERDRVPA